MWQTVKAVIAKKWERIDRSNLAGMGIVPFVAKLVNRDDADILGLTGHERFNWFA